MKHLHKKHIEAQEDMKPIRRKRYAALRITAASVLFAASVGIGTLEFQNRPDQNALYNNNRYSLVAQSQSQQNAVPSSTTTTSSPTQQPQASETLQQEINNLNKLGTNLQNEIAQLQTSLNTIKDEIPQTQKNMSTINAALPQITSNLNTINNALPQVQKEMATINKALPNAEKEIGSVSNAKAEIEHEVEIIGGTAIGLIALDRALNFAYLSRNMKKLQRKIEEKSGE